MRGCERVCTCVCVCARGLVDLFAREYMRAHLDNQSFISVCFSRNFLHFEMHLRNSPLSLTCSPRTKVTRRYQMCRESRQPR